MDLLSQNGSDMGKNLADYGLSSEDLKPTAMPSFIKPQMQQQPGGLRGYLQDVGSALAANPLQYDPRSRGSARTLNSIALGFGGALSSNAERQAAQRQQANQMAIQQANQQNQQQDILFKLAEAARQQRLTNASKMLMEGRLKQPKVTPLAIPAGQEVYGNGPNGEIYTVPTGTSKVSSAAPKP